MRENIFSTPPKLEIVDRHHPLWHEVTQQTSQRYQQAFNAKLSSFMPAFMVLTVENEMIASCGFRVAEDEPLFLEQYLDTDADVLVSQTFNTKIKRSQLIEFGQLSSFTRSTSPLHFLLMVETLVSLGYKWCIFTAIGPLHALMKRLGLYPTLIAEANPNNIPNVEHTWGTYYKHQPRIMAGNLQQGLTLLQARHMTYKVKEDRSLQCL